MVDLAQLARKWNRHADEMTLIAPCRSERLEADVMRRCAAELLVALSDAALSHAAGQEADYSAKFRHAGEWSRYPEGTRAHDINGGFWLKIDHRWKWMPDGGIFPTPAGSAFDVSVPAVARNDAAQPTTSAEVGRDAVFHAVQQGIDSIEVPKLTPARAEYFKAGIRAAIHSINRALAATSGRQAD